MILKNEVEALLSDVVGHITTKNCAQTCKCSPFVRIPDICYLCKPFISNIDVSNVKAV